jgi:hypothetical protein
MRTLADRLRQLDRREEQIRDEKDLVLTEIIRLAGPDADRFDTSDTVRRVHWRGGHRRRHVIVTLDREPIDLPLRLAHTFWALVKLGHAPGADPGRYWSAVEIAAWIGTQRPNREPPNAHCVESYISKLRNTPDGRFAELIEGDKHRGWRLTIRNPVAIGER